MPTDASEAGAERFLHLCKWKLPMDPPRPLPVEAGASPSITSASCTRPWTGAPAASSPLEPSGSTMDRELENRKGTVAFPAPVYSYFSLNLERQGFQQAAPTYLPRETSSVSSGFISICTQSSRPGARPGLQSKQPGLGSSPLEWEKPLPGVQGRLRGREGPRPHVGGSSVMAWPCGPSTPPTVHIPTSTEQAGSPQALPVTEM